MSDKTTNFLCNLIGHKWRYKDYSNWMNESGDAYPFRASRSCSRCDQFEYLNINWDASIDKSPYDLEDDSKSSKIHYQDSHNS